MSSKELLNQANDALVDDDFETALDLYNEAIDKVGDNSELASNIYTKRSTCYYKMGDFKSSWSDGLNAVHLNEGNAMGHLRKGMAAFSLGEFESALTAFKAGSRISDDRRFRTWIRKCEAEIDDESSSDDSNSGDIDVEEVISPAVQKERDSAPAPQSQQTHQPEQTQQPQNTQQDQTSNTAPQKKKYKHEWFQTQDYVCVTIFIRQVTEERLRVNIQPNSLEVIVQLDSGGEYNLDLDLCDYVNVETSSYKVLKTKIEIKLMKQSASHWPTLEREEGVQAQEWTSVYDPKNESKPHYPSSAKVKKDWNAIAKEAEKEEGEKSLNDVFAGIFKGADDEQRMAMQKSFYESGGTVLSTNWAEVGSKTVKGSAPKGMEMRSWKDDAVIPTKDDDPDF